MLKIVLGKSQELQLAELTEAYETLLERFTKLKKPDYNEKYKVLLMDEGEWENYLDPATQKKLNLVVELPDFTGADLEIIEEFNTMMNRVQLRRDMASKEKIRSIKMLARFKTLYFDVKALQDQFESFWLTTTDIRSLKSTELRSAEITLRTADIYSLRRKVEVYFKEGKHKDHGEAISYEYALSEYLYNLDSKRDILKKKFEAFKSRRTDN